MHDFRTRKTILDHSGLPLRVSEEALDALSSQGRNTKIKLKIPSVAKWPIIIRQHTRGI
jgi:hypothetical protein